MGFLPPHPSCQTWRWPKLRPLRRPTPKKVRPLLPTPFISHLTSLSSIIINWGLLFLLLSIVCLAAESAAAAGAGAGAGDASAAAAAPADAAPSSSASSAAAAGESKQAGAGSSAGAGAGAGAGGVHDSEGGVPVGYFAVQCDTCDRYFVLEAAPIVAAGGATR
jgi:hypothetical protein